MIHNFTLQNLSELDAGRICESWNQAVMRAANDCDDRPALKKPRKIMLELELTPVFQQDGAFLDSLNGTFRVKESVPTRESKEYSIGFRKKSGQPNLVFNDMSEDNVHQRTIDQEDE